MSVVFEFRCPRSKGRGRTCAKLLATFTAGAFVGGRTFTGDKFEDGPDGWVGVEDPDGEKGSIYCDRHGFIYRFDVKEQSRAFRKSFMSTYGWTRRRR